MSEPSQSPEVVRAHQPDQTWLIFRIFMLALGVAGCLMLLLTVARPHQTGVVTAVGHVSQRSYSSGTGRHASRRGGYASDVRVRAKDTGETVTVHYRVRTLEEIPAVGDEVEFADDPLVGYQPYPQHGFILLGAILMAAALAYFTGERIWKRRREKSVRC